MRFCSWLIFARFLLYRFLVALGTVLLSLELEVALLPYFHLILEVPDALLAVAVVGLFDDGLDLGAWFRVLFFALAHDVLCNREERYA